MSWFWFKSHLLFHCYMPWVLQKVSINFLSLDCIILTGFVIKNFIYDNVKLQHGSCWSFFACPQFQQEAKHFQIKRNLVQQKRQRLYDNMVKNCYWGNVGLLNHLWHKIMQESALWGPFRAPRSFSSPNISRVNSVLQPRRGIRQPSRRIHQPNRPSCQRNNSSIVL